jgi:hypothetical protein
MGFGIAVDVLFQEFSGVADYGQEEDAGEDAEELVGGLSVGASLREGYGGGHFCCSVFCVLVLMLV